MLAKLGVPVPRSSLTLTCVSAADSFRPLMIRVVASFMVTSTVDASLEATLSSTMETVVPSGSDFTVNSVSLPSSTLVLV